MGSDFNATLIAKIVGSFSSDVDLQTGVTSLDENITTELTQGIGADQAQIQWSDQRTLTASTSEDLDLAGVLTDDMGQTVTMTAVKFIAIKAASTNGDVLNIGGAASNQWATWVGAASDTIDLRPGGFICLLAPDATGYTVTAGTGDLLKIANADSGASATYDIYIVAEGSTS